MWEVAQGRFGARSMRACLESPHITLSQQRRIATAVILNSIPLATNPNGALLLTWLLDTSNFPSRYNLLAPRFTPHLSHLCTHKLASLTVLRIVNQKIEPEASSQIVDALFSSPGDHVLTDVLGDQVNGVAVVQKILTSAFIDPVARQGYVEATKRVLIELKVIATQAYRRLIEEVGLPVPNFQPTYATTGNVPQSGGGKKPQGAFVGMPGVPSGYPSSDQGLASVMAALQMGGQNPQSGPPQLQIDPNFAAVGTATMTTNNNNGRSRAANNTSSSTSSSIPYSPASDPFNPFAMRSPDMSAAGTSRANVRRPGNGNGGGGVSSVPMTQNMSPYGTHSTPQAGSIIGMGQPTYSGMTPPPPPHPHPSQSLPPHLYQAYMYQAYQQNPNMGTFHA
jgi:protein JSN1